MTSPLLEPSDSVWLDRFIIEQMTPDHVPGLSACLLSDKGVLWTKSYGLAHIANNTAMCADHIINIASISKTFTALAVLQQVEMGLLALDTDINQYLPFPVRNPNHAHQPITIKLLEMALKKQDAGELEAYRE